MTRPIDPSRIEVVDEKVAEILRRKTPAERVEMIFECNRLMRMAVAGMLRADHPDWTDEEIDAAVARRMLGESG